MMLRNVGNLETKIRKVLRKQNIILNHMIYFHKHMQFL